MTKIVNLRKDKFDVYIGRDFKNLEKGYFGNPIQKGKNCPVCNTVHHEQGSTLICYKKYFHDRMNSDKEFKEKVIALKGKTLGCFCKPSPCHGDIICEFLNSI